MTGTLHSCGIVILPHGDTLFPLELRRKPAVAQIKMLAYERLRKIPFGLSIKESTYFVRYAFTIRLLRTDADKDIIKLRIGAEPAQFIRAVKGLAQL